MRIDYLSLPQGRDSRCNQKLLRWGEKELPWSGGTAGALEVGRAKEDQSGQTLQVHWMLDSYWRPPFDLPLWFLPDWRRSSRGRVQRVRLQRNFWQNSGFVFEERHWVHQIDCCVHGQIFGGQHFHREGLHGHTGLYCWQVRVYFGHDRSFQDFDGGDFCWRDEVEFGERVVGNQGEGEYEVVCEEGAGDLGQADVQRRCDSHQPDS